MFQDAAHILMLQTFECAQYESVLVFIFAFCKYRVVLQSSSLRQQPTIAIKDCAISHLSKDSCCLKQKCAQFLTQSSGRSFSCLYTKCDLFLSKCKLLKPLSHQLISLNSRCSGILDGILYVFLEIHSEYKIAQEKEEVAYAIGESIFLHRLYTCAVNLQK